MILGVRSPPDPRNMIGVKGVRSDLNTHQNITNEWENFYRSNPDANRKQIESFADSVDDKYASDWFE